MSQDYEKPLFIELRYVIIHSLDNIKSTISEILSIISSESYNKNNISEFIQLSIISCDNETEKVSVANLEIMDMPYQFIEEFEDTLIGTNKIINICKMYDSIKIEENRSFLVELYNLEMKIREIYTILTRLQSANLKDSIIKPQSEYNGKEEKFNRRLMNEFFFIEFSAYKEIDKRKTTKMEDLLFALGKVKKVEDINTLVTELSYPTLHLEERFNKLSRIPEAIGRLGTFRNNIAHCRYINKDDIENLKKAKEIIDEVYNEFIMKIEKGEL